MLPGPGLATNIGFSMHLELKTFIVFQVLIMFNPDVGAIDCSQFIVHVCTICLLLFQFAPILYNSVDSHLADSRLPSSPQVLLLRKGFS